ncbi:hypothetical protein [Nostoc sp.]|uniref:hypothetical protein n=1 Tax=Nostoc sp. TaxID=1180 RepID=UPI002FFCE924
MTEKSWCVQSNKSVKVTVGRKVCGFQYFSVKGYGVHTSREIPPDTWFRPLAIGLCDRSESLSAARRNDEAIAKTHGIM